MDHKISTFRCPAACRYKCGEMFLNLLKGRNPQLCPTWTCRRGRHFDHGKPGELRASVLNAICDLSFILDAGYFPVYE